MVPSWRELFKEKQNLLGQLLILVPATNLHCDILTLVSSRKNDFNFLSHFSISVSMYETFSLFLLMREEHGEGGMKMNSVRTETIMTVSDYRTFEVFGKLPCGLALYFFVLEYKISS